MAALFFFYLHLLTLFFFSISTCVHSQKTNSTIITRGSTRAPTTNPPYWLSPSGRYAFGFYRRGTDYFLGIVIIGIPEQTVVWTLAPENPLLPRNSILRFKTDGNLVLQSPQENRTIASGETASMLDTGNFAMYDAAGNVTWQSFDNPSDTILPGQRLDSGKVLYSRVSEEDSSIGRFQLIMQQDSYVAMYPYPAPYEIPYGNWDSGPGSSGSNVNLTLTGDGRIYTFNDTGTMRVLSDGGLPELNFIYRATLDPDGIFRLYSYNVSQKGNWSVEWWVPDDKCAPKGLCGLNAFCTTSDLDTSCQCLVGFTAVNPKDAAVGCQRNSTPVGCDGIYKNVTYDIIDVPNTSWFNSSYSVIQTLTEDACRIECLNDCNCEVSLYGGGYCGKQTLPLRYGRRDFGISSTLLVKTTSDMPFIPNRRPREKKINTEVLVASFIMVAIGSAVLIVSAALIYRHRVWVRKVMPKNENTKVMEDVAPKSFPFDELTKVTKNFSEEIGKGAFGTVYKATLAGGQVVAVKRLERVSSDGEKEFQTEVKIIGRTHHRNLVRLVGYCLDGPNRLLVYDYMSNGSLADTLFTPNPQPNFDTKLRLARNVARGILYLHEECDTQIIHCDIKPQNILIDDHGLAKISDFGLSKLLKPDQTNTFTNIRGTRGYVAPEWHKRLPVTVKADVYSFGVVLLEIICCRRCLDHTLAEEEAVLEDWVYDCFQANELYRLVNGEEVDRRQLERTVKVALWCVLEEPSLRPSMRKVLLMLEGTIDISVPPRPNSFISAI